MTNAIDPTLIETMRTMARGGRMPSEMFTAIKDRLSASCHVVDIIRCFREAFGLTLAEAKPLACISGYPDSTGREVLHEPLLDSLILPVIKARTPEWDVVAE